MALPAARFALRAGLGALALWRGAGQHGDYPEARVLDGVASNLFRVDIVGKEAWRTRWDGKGGTDEGGGRLVRRAVSGRWLATSTRRG